MPRRGAWMVAASAAVMASTMTPGAAAIEAAAGDEHPWFGSLEWRCIGPARGGRVQSVAGVVGDPHTYYMGATGGGVWRTTDAGVTWRPVTDGFVGTGSVGAVAVAPSDPNVVYAGMGEADIRGNFSHGDGVYRSLDAGDTWTRVGLEDSRQIGEIDIHPADPDVVFVAALGHVWGPGGERGVFRSRDGGESWQRVLPGGPRLGAIDVAIDPLNPRVVYAGLWHVSRTPWRLDSGGPGGGLFRSRDGGDTWEPLTEGLPSGVVGKVSISPSRAQRGLVYAMVEAEDGGVFRSDDGGDSWRRVNEDRSLRQRAWYYTHVIADPKDADTVYVMNVGFHKSIDGGRTFGRIRVPHSDNHDLWIDPHDNTRMINGNDGGANVSFTGGDDWSTQTNQPTAQFYHVTVDDRVPYRVYGAQQDNSTASVSSRGSAYGNWQRDLYPVGGGESGYIAVHPDGNVVYAGSYGGYLTRYDHATRLSRSISVWPENPMGAGADVLEHRFQWTFPIVISPHDPETVYVAGERLFRTRDGGGTFEAISPDLTTNDKSKQRTSGGPITQDNTSVEYYCTIFALAESPLAEGTIWAGTDDGLVHLTRDGGDTWSEVTPPDLGDWPQISLIDASPHDADTAWLAVNRYKMNDFTPMVLRTRDGGETWDRLGAGMPDGSFVRAVREDPVRPGLLYAGTETGVFVSFDAGEHWTSLAGDMPATPITDLVVKDDDLVVATQGRSFWILDDLAVLRQLGGVRGDGLDAGRPQLFAPAPAYRKRWDAARLHVWLPAEAADAGDPDELAVLDADGELVRAWTLWIDRDAARGTDVLGEAAGEDDPDDADVDPTDADADDSAGRDGRDASRTLRPGMNLLRWDFRIPGPVRVPGAVSWPGHPSGARVAPGTYRVELRRGGMPIASQPFGLRGDPAVDTTAREYAEQFELLVAVQDRLSGAHRAVNDIRAMREQMNAALAQMRRAAGDGAELPADVTEAADALRTALRSIEDALIQSKSKSAQDPLNFPVRLNDKIAALAYAVDGDFPPTAASRTVFARLSDRLDAELDRLEDVRAEFVPAFNDAVDDARPPAVVPGGDTD